MEQLYIVVDSGDSIFNNGDILVKVDTHYHIDAFPPAGDIAWFMAKGEVDNSRVQLMWQNDFDHVHTDGHIESIKKNVIPYNP